MCNSTTVISNPNENKIQFIPAIHDFCKEVGKSNFHIDAWLQVMQSAALHTRDTFHDAI